MAPPGASDYCSWAAMGYVGFSWPMPEGQPYTCPRAAHFSTNGYGLAFCIWAPCAWPLRTSVYVPGAAVVLTFTMALLVA